MRIIFFLGLLSPLMLTSCFFKIKEITVFSCPSPDRRFTANYLAIQGGGAAGAQFSHLVIHRHEDNYDVTVLKTSTSNKLIVNWDSSNNLKLTINEGVKLYHFSNFYFPREKTRIGFEYEKFEAGSEVYQCIN